MTALNRPFRTFAVSLAAMASISGAALAAPASQSREPAPSYTAAEVVKRLAPPAGLGATRALCIGTASECAATLAPAPAQSFDLVISFDYNSDDLTAGARRNLDEFASALRSPQLSGRRFLIEGHTDGLGSLDFNQDLSDRRATAVAAYLAGRGIDGAKLTAQGFGKTRPRTANLMDAANRRVEARIAE